MIVLYFYMKQLALAGIGDRFYVTTAVLLL